MIEVGSVSIAADRDGSHTQLDAVHIHQSRTGSSGRRNARDVCAQKGRSNFENDKIIGELKHVRCKC